MEELLKQFELQKKQLKESDRKLAAERKRSASLQAQVTETEVEFGADLNEAENEREKYKKQLKSEKEEKEKLQGQMALLQNQEGYGQNGFGNMQGTFRAKEVTRTIEFDTKEVALLKAKLEKAKELLAEEYVSRRVEQRAYVNFKNTVTEELNNILKPLDNGDAKTFMGNYKGDAVNSVVSNIENFAKNPVMNNLGGACSETEDGDFLEKLNKNAQIKLEAEWEKFEIPSVNVIEMGDTQEIEMTKDGDNKIEEVD